MELAFVPLESSGWRGRGAPRKQAPPEILAMLQRTAAGEVGVIDVREDTQSEVDEVLAALRAGGRRLGRRVSIQQDEEHHLIRFKLGAAL